MDTVSIFDLLILLSGVYVLYSTFSMKTSGDIPTGVFVTKDVNITKDSDIPGFINYMFGRALGLGFSAALSGAAGLLNGYLGDITYIHYSLLAICFVFVVIFSVSVVKAQKEFLKDDPKKKR